MIRLFLLLLFLLFSLYGGQDNGKDLNQTQNNMIGTTFIVNPVGRYKTIKNEHTDNFIKTVFGSDEGKSSLAQKEYIENLGNYAPPAHFAMATLMVESGKYSEAIFYYILASLRTRYDIARCADNSVGNAPLYAQNERMPNDIRIKLGGEISKNKKMYTEIVKQVLKADADLPYNYDHRWVNKYGLRYTMAGLYGKDDNDPLTKPESEWSDLRAKVIEGYQKGIDKSKE